MRDDGSAEIDWYGWTTLPARVFWARRTSRWKLYTSSWRAKLNPWIRMSVLRIIKKCWKGRRTIRLKLSKRLETYIENSEPRDSFGRLRSQVISNERFRSAIWLEWWKYLRERNLCADGCEMKALYRYEVIGKYTDWDVGWLIRLGDSGVRGSIKHYERKHNRARSLGGGKDIGKKK